MMVLYCSIRCALDLTETEADPLSCCHVYGACAWIDTCCGMVLAGNDWKVLSQRGGHSVVPATVYNSRR